MSDAYGRPTEAWTDEKMIFTRSSSIEWRSWGIPAARFVEAKGALEQKRRPAK